MRWWLILLVVLGLLWWLGHRNLCRRARRLGVKGGLGGVGAVARPSCGPPERTLAGGPLLNSPTSSGSHITPAAVGTIPTDVSDEGPAAVPPPIPDMGLFQ